MKKKKRCHNIGNFSYIRKSFIIISSEIIPLFTAHIMETFPDLILLGHHYYFEYEEKNPEMSFHHD